MPMGMTTVMISREIPEIQMHSRYNQSMATRIASFIIYASPGKLVRAEGNGSPPGFIILILLFHGFDTFD